MATPDELDSEEFNDLEEDAEIEDLDDLSLAEDSDEDLDDLDYEDGDESGGDEEEADDGAEDLDADEEEADDEPELDDEEPDEAEESLDVILAREQDLEDEFAPADEANRSSPRTIPGEDEFTCRSCFLVKRRAQLADVDEMICLDCA